MGRGVVFPAKETLNCPALEFDKTRAFPRNTSAQKPVKDIKVVILRKKPGFTQSASQLFWTRPLCDAPERF